MFSTSEGRTTSLVLPGVENRECSSMFPMSEAGEDGFFARRRERGSQFAVFGRVMWGVVSGKENDRSTVSIYASEKGAFCNRRVGRRVREEKNGRSRCFLSPASSGVGRCGADLAERE